MAGIDKIYLRKNDALEFIRYLKSIDNEFKETFRNADSIMDWTYTTEEEILSWHPNNEDDEIAVTNFPQCIDAWLLRRDDLPQCARHYISTVQYSVKSVNTYLAKEPIVFTNELDSEPSVKFKIISKDGCFSKSLNPKSKYWIMLESYSIIYLEDEDKWVTNNPFNAYLIGKDNCTFDPILKIKSFKALKRKLLSWKLPKGTTLKIEDLRYMGKMLIKYE